MLHFTNGLQPILAAFKQEAASSLQGYKFQHTVGSENVTTHKKDKKVYVV